MDTVKSLIFVLIVTLSAAVGWKLRSTIFSCGKGAMLPGAIIGTFFALFSGSDAISKNFFIPAAVGAAAMFMDSSKLYSRTESGWESKTYWESSMGIFIKNGIWFALFGGFVSLSIVAMSTSHYKCYDLLILFAIMPFLRLLGNRIFSKTITTRIKRFPILYFSKRCDECGALIMIMLQLIALMLIRRDEYSLLMLFSGFTSGFFGALLAKKASKFKEYIVGGLSGLGISIFYLINYDKLTLVTSAIGEGDEIWAPLGRHAIPVLILWITVLLIHAIKHFMPAAHMQPDQKIPSGYAAYLKLSELSERPIYSYAPLFIVIHGGKAVSAITSVVLFSALILGRILCLYSEKTKMKIENTQEAII